VNQKQKYVLEADKFIQIKSREQ